MQNYEVLNAGLATVSAEGSPEKIGIAGLGSYTPQTFLTAKEIAQESGIPEEVIDKKFGVSRKPIPGREDCTSYMGIQAAKKALAMANVQPEEIDLILWNGAQHKDYPCWLASLKVGFELGCNRAWGFDMEAMCGSMMVGMETAKSLMLNNHTLKNVLLVSGYRNCDLISFKEADTSFMFDIGAGGSAMVLKKGFGRNHILQSAFKGDGSFSEDCVVPVGGSKKWPLAKADVDAFHFQIQGDAKEFKTRLGEKTMPNFYAVIRESLEKSGYTQKDIDYLAILHLKKSAHDAVLAELGLCEKNTTYLQNYGHIGQNDQILSMEIALQEGKIVDGSLIVMVGAGLGFVWASTVVRWGMA